MLIKLELQFVPLPTAVRHFSISPFISRSIALATSTLLYFEYLSNTAGEKKKRKNVRPHRNKHWKTDFTGQHSEPADLDGDEEHSCWWGCQWRRSSLCPSCPPRPRTEPWHHCQSAVHRLLQSCQPVTKTNRTISHLMRVKCIVNYNSSGLFYRALRTFIALKNGSTKKRD